METFYIRPDYRRKMLQLLYQNKNRTVYHYLKLFFISKQKQNGVPLFKIIEQSEKRQRIKVAMEPSYLSSALYFLYAKKPDAAKMLVRAHIAGKPEK